MQKRHKKTSMPANQDHEPARIPSIRKLADGVGRSHVAVAGWVQRDDWPFSRVPPWTTDEVPLIQQWADDNLRPGPERLKADSGDPFWKLHCEFERMNLPQNADFLIGSDAELKPLPVGLFTPFERAVLAEDKNLTAAQARALMRVLVIVKAKVAIACDWLPGWLAGRGRNEIGRRMRAVIYDMIGGWNW